MDRFIAIFVILLSYCLIDLKSNMDRFIALASSHYKRGQRNLKSNMDRFIDKTNYLNYLMI